MATYRTPRHWIAGAIKKPGALRASAKKAGAMTPAGTISKGYIASKASASGKLGQRARLAQTLAKMHKR